MTDTRTVDELEAAARRLESVHRRPCSAVCVGLLAGAADGVTESGCPASWSVLSAVAGDGVTVAGMIAADQVRARLLAEVTRILGTDDELGASLTLYRATEPLSQLAWRHWKLQGCIGSDADHAIAVAVEACQKGLDLHFACRYMVADCGTKDLVLILVASGRTPQEAVEAFDLLEIQ